MFAPQRQAPDAALLIDTLRHHPRTEPASRAAGWRKADIEADALVALAESERAELLLHRRLKALGVVLDGDAGTRLAAYAKRAMAQSLRGDAELETVLRVLDSVGVRALPLKGAAMRRLRGRVPGADGRSSSDVDVLVSATDAERAWDALVANGFRNAKPGPMETVHHLHPLIGVAGIGIELHTTTDHALSADDAWRRFTRDPGVGDLHGRTIEVPSDTELLWHAVTHGVRHAGVSVREGIRLRHWMDAAAIIAAADASIDWERLNALLATDECGAPEQVRRWIATAAALAGRALPERASGGGVAYPPPINLERLLGWRLYVARAVHNERWSDKLLEEGARREAGLPRNPGYPGEGLLVNARHNIASRAARAWWRLRR